MPFACSDEVASVAGSGSLRSCRFGLRGCVVVDRVLHGLDVTTTERHLIRNAAVGHCGNVTK